MKTIYMFLLFAAWASVPEARSASFLEKFGLGKASTNTTSTLTTALSQDEISSGLKAALSKGVERAVSTLGKDGGFLKDASVKIPMPENLQKVERALRSVGQDKLAEEFVATMNTAAEKAVPEAAAVLGGAVQQMTVADAKAILTSTNNAATAYFKRTAGTNLYERFLPIVQKATEQAGVTSAYKKMTEKARFGGFSAVTLLGNNAADLDGYITRKALDGLFLKVGQEEQQIRESPAARSTELLQKVFGAVAQPKAAPVKK